MRRAAFHWSVRGAATAALLAIAIAGCGGASAGTTGGSGESGARFAGAELTPRSPAPPLVLRNSLGRRIDLAAYRGKAVLITFIYTHCPDTCPLIVSHLKTAQAELGPKAKNLEIIGVSTDPRGDTPKTVAAFLRKRGMTGRMQYLIGSRHELEKVWREWNVISKPAGGNVDRVGHSALVYGIAADGRMTTIYPANFAPRQIAHDVPLLEQG
jgi:protein SCO1